jgi:charged multivesicular body protein 1
MEGARIYGQNVIREKNQALNFLRLSSRVDAVAARLETAIRMQQVNKAMGQTVKGMSNAMKAMDPEKIAKTMEQFEKQFEDMDVRSGYMEDTMDATTAMSTPPEQVDNLIQMVADEAGLQLEGLIDSAGPVGTKGPAQPGLNIPSSPFLSPEPPPRLVLFLSRCTKRRSGIETGSPQKVILD